MKAFFTYGLFPVHFFSALVAAHFAFVAGYSAPVILGVISAITAVTLLWVERVHPAHSNWNVSQKDVGTDAMHALVSMILLPKLLEILLASALIAAATSLATEFDGVGIWPSHWPIAGQLALALLISQFGEYWVHRCMHTVPILWRLHATHHSPGRLYWLSDVVLGRV